MSSTLLLSLIYLSVYHSSSYSKTLLDPSDGADVIKTLLHLTDDSSDVIIKTVLDLTDGDDMIIKPLLDGSDIIIIIITQLLTRHMSVIKTNRRRGRQPRDYDLNDSL